MSSFYSTGCRYECLMRIDNHESKILPFCPFKSKIVYLACGSNFTLLYTDDHTYYGGGENSDRQLGEPDYSLSPFTPLPAFQNIIPRWIACGNNFSAVLDRYGSLHAFGLGFGADFIVEVPPIKKFCCGGGSMMAIPEPPCGLYFIQPDTPAKLFFENQKIVDCAAGDKHFIALTEDKDVYIWGSGSACGLGRNFKSLNPVLLKLSGHKFKQIFASLNSTFLIDEHNAVFTAGKNIYSQLGTGKSSKIKLFTKVNINTIKFPIKQIEMTLYTSYILDDNGDVFVSGTNNTNLLLSQYSNVYATFAMFTKIKNTGALGTKGKVSFISAGSGHVILSTDFVPKLGSLYSKKKKYPIPYFKNYAFHNEKETTKVDISDAAFAYIGFDRNSVIWSPLFGKALILGVVDLEIIGCQKIIESKTDYDENDENDENNENILEGSDNSDENYNFKINFSNPILLHRQLKLFKPHQNMKVGLTRSGFSLLFDKSDEKCRVFGFLSGEVVQHEMIGEGIVFGVLGNSIWFQWNDDNKFVSQASHLLYDLHDLVEIIQSDDRTTSSFQLQSGQIINIEVEPCKILAKYDLKVNDIVLYNQSLCIVFGEFGYNVAIQYIFSDKYDVVLPNCLKLIRRESDEPSIVPVLAFDGTVVDVNLSFNEFSDRFIPLDRVLTSKGFATVIGKEVITEKGEKDDSVGYWIQTDEAFVLNLGIVLIKSIRNVRLLRRWSENTTKEDDIIVSHSPFQKEERFYAGDVLFQNFSYFLVLGFDDISENLVIKPLNSDSNLNNSENIKKGRIVCNKNDIEFGKFSEMICYRAGFKARSYFNNKNHMQYFGETNLENFQGVGFKPGDIISFQKGEAIIIAMNDHNVWIKNKAEEGCTIISQNDIYKHEMFHVIKRIGIGLDLTLI